MRDSSAPQMAGPASKAFAVYAQGPAFAPPELQQSRAPWSVGISSSSVLGRPYVCSYMCAPACVVHTW